MSDPLHKMLFWHHLYENVSHCRGLLELSVHISKYELSDVMYVCVT